MLLRHSMIPHALHGTTGTAAVHRITKTHILCLCANCNKWFNWLLRVDIFGWSWANFSWYQSIHTSCIHGLAKEHVISFPTWLNYVTQTVILIWMLAFFLPTLFTKTKVRQWSVDPRQIVTLGYNYQLYINSVASNLR